MSFKKIVILFLTSILFLCDSCTFNPLKKYAHEYWNVVWTSTSNSDVKVILYVLNKNQPYSLSIINYENKDYYFCGSIADQLHIFNVNDHGFIGFNNDNYEENKRSISF